MAAKVISGTEIAKEIRGELKERVSKLKEQGVTPGLVMIRVGEDPASVSYVSGKEKAAEEIGVWSQTIVLPESASEEELLAKVEEMNRAEHVDGILVQLPLPKHINADKVLTLIDPAKDVDGFHPINVGKMLIGDPYFMPCTPHGAVELMIRSGNPPEGKHVVICGRSNIVGKPLMAMLVQKNKRANATVTVVHTGTKNMAEITRQADILVAAMGSPEVIKADMVKEGAVVIDVGVNRVGWKPSKKDPNKQVPDLRGDVEFETVKEKASAITPVPGGVGPMTITMLMVNTVVAAERRAERMRK
ncbi:MAG: bifunctional 5,10-methylene-tetrahydrofolate dehydrogenase/5,10-methylene-tetrahydrofolate cyclohydrolase [Dehalococcoidia bacterium]|nr:bifunctional 5,10-methylene-tetrahydrofolate dehydrogenase/5,10-methylene-tetrahydrofolate cyclohydrolase [Dehalococcoidia bacterium]RLC63564.1 MAG: bifunctional 5,10-methylene-tetrahydrofolate dehydrogenase/5,10-methylene-tetrahydrofolate cyclohydrolase [Chloroflexota bacterium]